MSRRPEPGKGAAGTDDEPLPGPGGAVPLAPGKLSLTQLASAPFGALPMSAAPGKYTLTQLVSVSPGFAPASRSGAGASTHHPQPARVADAEKDRPKPNAVLKVVVIDDGKVIQAWQSRARWEGPLPQQYTATRAGAGWQWDNSDGKSVKVQTDERGGHGKPVEAWANPAGDRIIVHARASDDVTIDEHAEVDALAPGHARGKQGAGDGSTTRIERGGEGARTGDAHEPRQREQGERRGEEQRAPGPDGQIGKSKGEADATLADEFERQLGILLDDPAADPEGGGEFGGRGAAGGARDGRRGDDTRRGGTGPGGEQARSDAKGRGSEDGRAGRGSEGGSRDGQKGGDEEGMYGGEGQHGDRGVPSAIALFGGIVSVPVALRGLVEVALIASSGDLTGAGAQLFRKGLGELASVVAVRKMVAVEARLAAFKETEEAIARIAKDRKTASAWAKLTSEQKDQVARIIYWELQRKYFKGYLEAAKQAKAKAKAALGKAPGSVEAQQRLQTAELAEEAATVSPVAGRLPQKHELAGKQLPADLLPPEYRKQGVRFTETGFPDFEPHALTLPNGKKYVEIEYTGNRRSDFAAADAKAGYVDTPGGYTWHHHEELGRMYLVPIDLHRQVKHTGGVATYKHVTGDVKSYDN